MAVVKESKRILIISFFLVLIQGSARGAEERPSYADACSFGESAVTHFTGTAGCLILGWLVGFGAHEGGHYLVSGGEIEFKGSWMSRNEGRVGPVWTCSECSHGQIQTIALAGFTEQIISTELLLGFKNIPREHPLIVGFLAWNIINPIAYTIRAETGDCDSTNCDLAHFDRNDRRIIEAVIVTHAIFSAYRLLFKDDRFPFLVTSTGRDVIVHFGFKF